MDNKILEMIEELKHLVEYELKASQQLYDNYYSEGLCINAIEAEGYLRAVKTIRNEFYEIINQKPSS